MTEQLDVAEKALKESKYNCSTVQEELLNTYMNWRWLQST